MTKAGRDQSRAVGFPGMWVGSSEPCWRELAGLLFPFQWECGVPVGLAREDAGIGAGYTVVFSALVVLLRLPAGIRFGRRLRCLVSARFHCFLSPFEDKHQETIKVPRADFLLKATAGSRRDSPAN